jgi:hypothetical protein
VRGLLCVAVFLKKHHLFCMPYSICYSSFGWVPGTVVFGALQPNSTSLQPANQTMHVPRWLHVTK